MIKYLTLGIITILFVFIFTGWRKNYSYKETPFNTVVIQCQEGTYHPDLYYTALANTYLVQKNYALSAVYRNLANANGKYDYQLTIRINGENYTVTRERRYEVGQDIIITKLDTYWHSRLIKTEYK